MDSCHARPLDRLSRLIPPGPAAWRAGLLACGCLSGECRVAERRCDVARLSDKTDREPYELSAWKPCIASPRHRTSSNWFISDANGVLRAASCNCDIAIAYRQRPRC